MGQKQNLPRSPELSGELLAEFPQPPFDGGIFLGKDRYEVPTEGIPFQQLRGKESIGGTVVESTLLVPDEIIDPVPLAIAPGYLGDSWAYADLGKYIAANGKPVLIWKFPRRQGIKGMLDPRHTLYPQRLACEALWGSVRNMQRRTDIPRVNQEVVDAAGHSRGGPTVMRAAMHKPHAFQSLIFDASAGLEDHTTAIMLGRLKPFFKEELVPVLARRELRQPVHIALHGLANYILANPLRTAAEAIDISKENITPFLEDDRVAHIGKAIYGYHADRLINIHKSIQRSGHAVQIRRIHSDQTLGHLGPQLRPEAVGYDYLQMLAEIKHHKLAPSPAIAKAA